MYKVQKKGLDKNIMNIALCDDIATERHVLKNFIDNYMKNAHIIFCSTSNEFAAESYNFSAFYYIIKPIDEALLISSLDKFVQIYYKVLKLRLVVKVKA